MIVGPVAVTWISGALPGLVMVGAAPDSVTVRTVMAAFSVHVALFVAAPPQVMTATVPSLSWMVIVELEVSGLDCPSGSLKVTVNWSPGSARFVVTRFALSRVSASSGAVVSGAGVVSVIVAGLVMSLPTMSWVSFAPAVRVTVYAVAAASGDASVTVKEVAAAPAVAGQVFVAVEAMVTAPAVTVTSPASSASAQ